MLTERLSRLRIAKKRTHQDLADYLGITRQAYSNYESGKRDVDTSTLNKLADYYDVSIDYLLGRSNNPSRAEESNDPEIAELLEELRQKGAELEATALLRTASKMNKEQLKDILKVFEMIEKDED